ncbi:MAG: phage tail tube protein [Pseudomonadota bacterium]
MTRDAYGRDAHVLMRRRPDGDVGQGTVQTHTAGPFLQIPVFSATIGVSQPLTEEAKLPQSRNPSRQFPDLADASGSIVTCLDTDYIGYHLTALLGAPDTTGTEDPYQHVWTVGLADLLKHDFYVEDRGLTTPRQYRHEGVVYNTMAINVAKSGAAQRVTFGLLSEEEVLAAQSADADPIAPAATAFEFRSWQASVAVEGATDAGVVGCDFTLSNGLEPDQGLLNAKATPAGNLLGNFSLNGSLRVRARNDFFKALARANALADITIGYTQSDNRSISMVLHNAAFPRAPTELNGAGVIEESYNFALDEPEDGVSPVTITLNSALANFDMPS